MSSGPVAAAPATTVACNGVFAKDSTHLKLAVKYDSRNIVYTDVDGPDGSKIKASVLYPNDPKKRLEVLWNNDAAREEHDAADQRREERGLPEVVEGGRPEPPREARQDFVQRRHRRLPPPRNRR